MHSAGHNSGHVAGHDQSAVLHRVEDGRIRVRAASMAMETGEAVELNQAINKALTLLDDLELTEGLRGGDNDYMLFMKIDDNTGICSRWGYVERDEKQRSRVLMGLGDGAAGQGGDEVLRLTHCCRLTMTPADASYDMGAEFKDDGITMVLQKQMIEGAFVSMARSQLITERGGMTTFSGSLRRLEEFEKRTQARLAEEGRQSGGGQAGDSQVGEGTASGAAGEGGQTGGTHGPAPVPPVSPVAVEQVASPPASEPEAPQGGEMQDRDQDNEPPDLDSDPGDEDDNPY
ncbi:hypothetical protein JK182_01565 [Acetobacter okinawensis]|uniref:hypothetical protein n=1 Tax=Acetobacter okinawensis TaxID=1076594 RepID=UPI001BA82CD1|nr:hypothetical protein [Acetobacter okinawensis]MBS0987380.1 hypothetical protein [Acetobacter okinawensis]